MRRWAGVTGGGGGEERSCMALFEPMLPDLARRRLHPKDGNIKHQR